MQRFIQIQLKLYLDIQRTGKQINKHSNIHTKNK